MFRRRPGERHEPFRMRAGSEEGLLLRERFHRWADSQGPRSSTLARTFRPESPIGPPTSGRACSPSPNWQVPTGRAEPVRRRSTSRPKLAGSNPAGESTCSPTSAP
jgi:hypothetical protein